MQSFAIYDDKLGLVNLNELVMIQKNWPCDAHNGSTFKEDVVEKYLLMRLPSWMHMKLSYMKQVDLKTM